MYYSGSVSPPDSPPKKKYIVPKKVEAKEEMTDEPSASSASRGGVKEGQLVWPMLGKSNYAAWVMIMQCNLEAMEVWYTIDPSTNVKRHHDRQAMAGLLRSVPEEMWQMLGRKSAVKEAWEAVATMRIGADRVKEVNAQRLMEDFKNIKFKEGESIEAFGMRISNLAAQLRELSEDVKEPRVVKKFLRVVPARFAPVVVSIEMFCDAKTMTVEELVGRLRAAEEWLEDKVEQIVDKTGRLLLAKEEWLEKHKHQFRTAPNKEGGGNGGAGHAKNKQAMARTEGGSGEVKLTSMGMPRRRGHCRNCGIYGHWAEDCKRPKKEKKKEARQPEANVAVGGTDQASALMLAACDIVHTPQCVHLSEKVIPVDVPDGLWVVDTGASNHMTGSRSMLS
jgi:hypothetical protein